MASVETAGDSKPSRKLALSVPAYSQTIDRAFPHFEIAGLEALG